MKNKTAIVAIAALAIIGIISGTYAYFTSTATTVNDFAANTYETVIERSLAGGITGMDPGDTYNITTLDVKNQGSTEIAVRAKITENVADSVASDLTGLTADGATAPGSSAWLTKDGAAGTTDLMLKAVGTDWTYGKDGYYYYQGTLTQGEATTQFIKALRFNINAQSDSKCYYATSSGEGSSKVYSVDETKKSTSVDTNKAGDIICTTDATTSTNSYTGATYTLNVQFETAQASQAKGYWGVSTDADMGATLNAALTDANTRATTSDTSKSPRS